MIVAKSQVSEFTHTFFVLHQKPGEFLPKPA